jgi:sterol desaturase/sphingolipid hydroxylase (fatty acid hydroxylase superfamily)
MHLPDSPVVQFIRESNWFKWIDRHHRIHHMKASTNFNLVLPIADLFIGTLCTQEPKKEK